MRKLGLLFGILLLIRNLWLFWNYSFGFNPDSTLYVHLGADFFRTWYISPLVTFPYPLVNALTASSITPIPLVLVQLILSAAVGGFFVYVAARRDRTFAILVGALLVFDLVWGAFVRSMITDGVFATFNLLALAILLLHYDRRENIPTWELLVAGFVLALAVGIRPSNIFLGILLPPLYLWMTRSWKKVAYLMTGMAVFFLIMGLINLKGTRQFYILAGGRSYTDQYLSYPLFVYGLFSPDNGPASQLVDANLQACYPGMDYIAPIQRSEGGAFDSPSIMNFVMQQVMPCLSAPPLGTGGRTNLVRTAYLEAFTKSPVHFTQVIAQEMAVFLRYSNPYMLRFQLNAEKNYGCSDIIWCDQINQSRATWDHNNRAVWLYEKVAAKVLQVYLAPVQLFSFFSPDKAYFPYLLSWLAVFILGLVISRGRLRLMLLCASVLILYTAAVVVAALGFTERYAAMLSTAQTVYSSVVWLSLARLVFAPLQKKLLRRQAYPQRGKEHFSQG